MPRRGAGRAFVSALRLPSPGFVPRPPQYRSGRGEARTRGAAPATSAHISEGGSPRPARPVCTPERRDEPWFHEKESALSPARKRDIAPSGRVTLVRWGKEASRPGTVTSGDAPRRR